MGVTGGCSWGDAGMQREVPGGHREVPRGMGVNQGGYGEGDAWGCVGGDTQAWSWGHLGVGFWVRGTEQGSMGQPHVR